MNKLYSGFLESAQAMPEREALFVEGESYTYGQLLEQALRIAATIQRHRPQVPVPSLTAVFADRSFTGFAGILGALLAGDGYVPLNANFPAARTARMLQRSGARALIVDSRAVTKLDDVMEMAVPGSLVIVPNHDDAARLSARWKQHTFLSSTALAESSSWTEASTAAETIAYLLFTSGSTGDPKGVPVSHANVTHFVKTMVERYEIAPDDRFSQLFDSTFDLSVFDMFVAWSRGAAVYCPSRVALLNPDKFVREHELTVWFSVPSVGSLMHRFGALKPNRYQSLRLSLFCGEPLPVALAQAWSVAAPGSILENLYGPTELTVACAAYRWDPDKSPAESCDGIVPIGAPLAGMSARVVDDTLHEVAAGRVGELVMTGPQRTSGYWDEAVETARAHVSLRGEVDVYYRTGDRVRKPKGDGVLTFVGRTDHQIKVLGHRVELGEVESALRAEPGVDAAVAVAWPVTNAGASGIAAFVTGQGIDAAVIRANVRGKLQAYAVPQTIRVLQELPQNSNGKVDRQALVSLLTA